MEALIPVAIVFALAYGFFHFFFDNSLRKGIEWIGSHVIGAEVNVGAIHTRFLKGSFQLRKLQVTNKEKPSENLVQIEEIRFQFLWDALLRMKFVIEEAAIDNIQTGVPRQRPGFVIPPTKDDGKPSLIGEVQKDVLVQTQKQLNENIFGDVAGLLAGGGASQAELKKLEGSLKSIEFIKGLEKQINDKKAAWDTRLKTLPQDKEVEEFSKSVKALKFDTKNPVEFANSVKKAGELIQQADQKVKAVQEAVNAFNSDLALLDGSYKQLNQLTQEDLKALQTRFKIPSINPSDFSKKLFMGLVQQRIASLGKYAVMALHYMPVESVLASGKKTKAEKADDDLVPEPRAKGKNIRFRITSGYPTFWLKHASISSKANESEYSGDLKGELINVTTHPAVVGRPAVLNVAGDFPKQQITGFQLNITSDHTKEIAKESFTVKAASYPVDRQTFSDSKDLRFVMTQAAGEAEISGTLENSVFAVNMANRFRNAKYDIETPTPFIKDVLSGVVQGIPTVNVSAQVKGTFDNFAVNLNSNLGDEIAKGFEKQLKVQIDKAQASLRAMLDEKLKPEKDRLNRELDQFRQTTTRGLDNRKVALEKAKSGLQKDTHKASPLNNSLDDLKKQFGL